MTTASITLPLNEAYEFSGGIRTLGENGISILTGGNIGLDYYPIWDEAYRATLNGKIYDHYYLREIGVETIEVFAYNMRTRMQEIMPFYNELYKTKLDIVDPLRTIDLTTLNDATMSQTVSASSENDVESTNKSGQRSIQSDFPQNMLAGSSDYASAGSDVNGTTSVETNGNETSESDSEGQQHSDTRVTGYQGNQGDIINAVRAAILNIDLMIINDLEPMFLQVFNTGDSYSQRNGYYPWYL